MSKNLHHSNLLIGTKARAELHLNSLCEDLNFKIANNPDFCAFRVETFGIDEARMLKDLSLRRPIGDRKIFLISPDTLTHEAQNALLKTFEDPTPNTHFFLVVREESQIIPTLLSRMSVLHLEIEESDESGEAREFLKLSIRDRLLFAKKFVEAEKDVSLFLDNLLLILRKDERSGALVESVYKLALLARNSVSPRLIIEHLALVLQ